jgi:thioredoxin-related protein
MKKTIFTLAVMVLFLSRVDAQTAPVHGNPESASSIQWMTLQEALLKVKDHPKKIYIDVYTKWCGWCKRMDASTFEDSKVISYMNTHYYPVKLDAETHDTLEFHGKPYYYKAEYKANELAAYLLNGQMSYPTATYLDEQTNMIGPVPGYLTGDQLLPVLKYFAEDIYKTTRWEDYLKTISK